MGNELKESVKLACEKIFAFAGEKIHYQAGEKTWEMEAVRGSLMQPSVGEPGRRTIGRNQAWNVNAAELLEKLGRKPQAGDRVLDSQGVAYDVVSPPGGFCFEFVDPYRLVLKVQTLER